MKPILTHFAIENQRQTGYIKHFALLLILIIAFPHYAFTQSCLPISSLSCDQVQVTLPYSLTFGGAVSGTVPDRNGAGTGFTMVDAYSGTRPAEDGSPSNSSLPGYEASKLTLASGRLQLVTNKGIAWLTNNNQLNALGVRVDSRSALQAQVTL
ncbi:hypothetical protein Q4E40_12645, partial [Pontibacter sp. BT731]|uniref:hypothetical protein n=1 Tax=Pontibacter coccineus TaxID=3063328 RepID=UPI0026E17B48